MCEVQYFVSAAGACLELTYHTDIQWKFCLGAVKN